jgi:hypothetical protein
VSSVVILILFDFNEKKSIFTSRLYCSRSEYSPSFVLAGLGGSLRVDLVFVFLMDFVSSLLVSPARSFSRVPVFFRR